jgi:Lipocalin-like domain
METFKGKPILKAKLLGAWRLTGYLAEGPNGDVVYPLGSDATGYIMYTPDGHMSASVMRSGRPKFSSSDLVAGTPEEHATAAAGYLAYAGTFDVDDSSGVVIHHIQTALVPNWVGNDFKRKVILDGDKLELRALAPSLVGGEIRLVRVLWDRAL